MIFEIPSNYLAAVQASCAIEDNPRPHVRSVHLDVKEKVLVGADGIIMTVVPIQNLRDTNKGFVNFRPIPLVRTLEPYVVTIDTDRLKASFRGKMRDMTETDGLYPNWKKVWDTEFVPTDRQRIALNPRPLEKVARSISTRDYEVIIAIELGESISSPAKISYSGIENTEIKSIFMLCDWPKIKIDSRSEAE